MHSIRLKITAVTIAAILTSILALGGIGILTIGAESDRNSAEKMRLISENMQMKLNAYLDSIRQSVDMAIRVAHDSLDDPDLTYLGKSGTGESVARLDVAMAKHCGAVERAFSSIAGNTSGIVTYYYCVNSDYGSNVHGFFWSNLDGDGFEKQADIISAELDPRDMDHNTWYFSAMRAASAVWIGPYRARFLGDRWTISYVAPIFHQGFVVGVLGMDILFDTMVEHISAQKVYDTGFAFLMDRDGDIVWHPDMPVGGAPIALDDNLSRDLLLRRSTGDMLVRYSRGGKQWQLAFATLSDDHKVAVTAPVSEITASQRRMTFELLLVAGAILAIFTVVSLIVMNALTKPLLRLTNASQKLIAGEYDVVLDYEGRDEVGILTNAFRQMRDHLKLYISDLNSRAYTDAMTGVKNKGAFTASIGRISDMLRVSGTGIMPGFGIIIFDLNDLKRINDVYGHNYGDVYLKTACRVICKTFAHSPVFRMGGDEFSVILQNQDYENRDALMALFEEKVGQHNATAEQPWDRISVSKGLAVFDPDADHTVEDVLQRADERMYEDKRRIKSGR